MLTRGKSRFDDEDYWQRLLAEDAEFARRLLGRGDMTLASDVAQARRAAAARRTGCGGPLEAASGHPAGR